MATITLAGVSVGAAHDEPQGMAPGELTIAGVVTAADTGQPIHKAEVHLEGGALQSPLTTHTDADGKYTFSGLRLGQYSVSAWKLGYVKGTFRVAREASDRSALREGGSELDDTKIALVRAGVIVATVTDEIGEPVAGAFLTVLREMLSGSDRKLMPAGGPAFIPTTDDQGNVRLYNLAPGKYYVAARTTALSRLGGKANRSPQVFYPGTLSPLNAAPVTVDAGQEVRIMFPLVNDRLARISGTILSSSGEPVRSPNLQLLHVGAGGSTSFPIRKTGDGGFVAEGLPPGSYLIQVRPEPGGDHVEFGSYELHVRGEDLDGLVVATTRPALIHGRMILDGRTVSGEAGARAVRIVPRFSGMTVARGEVAMSMDGTFELRGILGRGLIRAQDPTNTWYLDAVYDGERDITDSVLDFKELDGKVIEVRLTRRPAALSGVAVDSAGRPVSNSTVVAFSQDEHHWRDTSRRIVTGRADQSGRFRVVGLPAGDYFVAAVERLEPGQEFSADLLQRLRVSATRVTLERHASLEARLVVTNAGG